MPIVTLENPFTITWKIIWSEICFESSKKTLLLFLEQPYSNNKNDIPLQYYILCQNW